VGAYVKLRKEVIVRAGLPLHRLEYKADGVVIVDDENGLIAIETDSLEYTFRHRFILMMITNQNVTLRFHPLR
jgi:hypothetical protein